MATHLLLLALLPAATARCEAAGMWVDADSSSAACSSASEKDGVAMTLVFSDEFETEGRTFADGHDARWTALQLAPTTTEQVNWYNASLASTHNGALHLTTTALDVEFPLYDSAGLTGLRHFQSAMVQTWQKFCFSEGAVEVSAKMPGRAEQPGLWPAFWMMGNLGRAAYQASTDGIWPWTFNECVEESDAGSCEANQCRAQKLSACDAAPGHGLNAYQGRGSPEIDVLEVMPGDVSSVRVYSCANLTAAQQAAIDMTRPFVSTSLPVRANRLLAAESSTQTPEWPCDRLSPAACRRWPPRSTRANRSSGRHRTACPRRSPCPTAPLRSSGTPPCPSTRRATLPPPPTTTWS